MPNPTVLIVDDNETVRTLLKKSLEKESYQVFEAIDGAKGYDTAIKENPDIINSDILLPNMEGFEFCRKIREESEIPGVPFIFLSSLAEISTELRSYRTGADDYLVKSNLKKQELIEKIETLLQKSETLQSMEENLDEGLVGRVSDTSLIEIIQLLSINKKSGILRFSSGEEVGEIFFREGNLHHAAFTDLHGVKAIFAMVEREAGIFRFAPEEIPEDQVQTIMSSPMNVIMDCCRLQDEKRQSSDA
jgi:CheY-like chemotaxis protein